MYESRKSKKILILLLITITISFFELSEVGWEKSNVVGTSKSYTDYQPYGGVKPADYSAMHSDIGENMNIALHQSLINTTEGIFPNLDNYSTLVEACPKSDLNFNSSYIEIDVAQINAPNKTLDIESSDPSGILDMSTTVVGATHIISRGSGYIENVAVRLTNVDLTAEANCQIVLYTYDSGNNRPAGTNQTDVYAVLGNFLFPNNTYNQWYTLTGIHQFINNSDTDDNKWFIGLIDNSIVGGDMWWDYTRDDLNFGGDGVDETDSYLYSGGAWTLYQTAAPVTTIDFNVRVDLAPLNNTPKPSQINLTINGKEVNDVKFQSGKWIETTPFVNPSGNLHFIISGDWWDTSCKITNVLINYTKTDLLANSEFIIAGSGQAVNWNVTRNGGLNFFDPRFTNYQVNFTIPASWLDPSIRVFNGAVERTLDITKRLIGNGYREIKVPNAGNGTFWYLTADSTNLLYSIDTYINLTPTSIFSFTNLVHFNATFSTEIIDGIINLSIYSPSILNNELNYSIEIQSFIAGSVINLTDWDISDNITQYGNFRVQVYWSNNTAVGFLEKTIRILGVTTLITDLPGSVFSSSNIFDVDLFFNDTGLNKGINGALVTYRINNGAIRSDYTDLGNGNYRITIDCNDTDFSLYGPNSVEVNASKIYYNNQSSIVQITILGESALVGSIPKSSFNSTETFDVSLFFNDTVKNIGIDGASINVYVNGSPYTPLALNDYLDGNYDITINCDDAIFDSQGYGFFNLRLDVLKSYYYNHTTSYIIYIMGETSLSVTKYPDPAVGYYNSDDKFNVTVYFEDIGRSEGINGALVKVYVKEVSDISYQEYITVIDPFGIGYYNFTIDCSDPQFSDYGRYYIKINITKVNYYTATHILDEMVGGNTTLTIIDPIGIVSYVEDEIFDITIEYMDHTQSVGITGATISYTLNGTGYRNDNIVDNLDGTYNITVNAGDKDFGFNYGYINIIIKANKINYINLTRTFEFERQIITQLNPQNPPPLLQVIKGTSIFYIFNYSDRLGNPIESYDIFQNNTNLFGFEWNIVNNGFGNYTLELNSTNVMVIGIPYLINFSISAFRYESQILSFTILITMIKTDIEIESWNELADFARSTRINVSIDFYFNDTTNNNPITGLSSSDIEVRNYMTGTIWSPGFKLYDRIGDGNYKLNISTVGAISGLYTLELKISKFPNYNWSLLYIQFYLRGNYTTINLISLSDPGGQLSPTGINSYTIFEGSDIDIEFNVTDLEYGNGLVLGDADSYTVLYENFNTLVNGTLLNTLHFIYQTPVFGTHVGTLTTSNFALTPGNYLIRIMITKSNYESTFFSFNLTIIEKYQVDLKASYQVKVDAGDTVTIKFSASYFNGTLWLPLAGTNIILTPYFDGIASTEIQSKITNSTGEILFIINVRNDATTMNISIQLQQEYYHLGETLMISDISVIPIPSVQARSDLWLYILIISVVIVGAAGSFIAYKRIVLPKKQRKSITLEDVKTIFEDAINLEHILVLYKKTGACILFKTFISEEIHPVLISGFISVIRTFGEDLDYQEKVNEITHGDKILLLSDGIYVRVGLILNKKSSLILNRNLIAFVFEFEKNYINELLNWKGQFNAFKNVGKIIDEKLSTSINLPHEISYDTSSITPLKNPSSKDILQIVEELMRESERNFFFINNLLKEATEKTHRDTIEIFIGIKELRDKKILIPLEISTGEVQQVNQQELERIKLKVAELVNLTSEDKEDLVNNLAQIIPTEREVYLTSLMEQHEIISPPIGEKLYVAAIESVKDAKKEITNLKKMAQQARNEKDYEKAINIYTKALKIATDYELTGEIDQLNEFIQSTKSEEYFDIKKS